MLCHPFISGLQCLIWMMWDSIISPSWEPSKLFSSSPHLKLGCQLIGVGGHTPFSASFPAHFNQGWFRPLLRQGHWYWLEGLERTARSVGGCSCLLPNEVHYLQLLFLCFEPQVHPFSGFEEAKDLFFLMTGQRASLGKYADETSL